MNLTCQHEDLLAALVAVTKAVPSRQINEFRLAPYVNLATRAKTLTLFGTNGESGLRYDIPAHVSEGGSTLLPLKTLSELIGSWKSGLLSIESVVGKPLNLTLTSDASRSTSTLLGVDPQEYPVFQQIEGRPIILDAGQLKTMIFQVAFAAGEDPSRPIFTLILMEMGADTFQLVAVDDVRLARSSCPLAGMTRESVLVPARALSRLATLLPAAGAVELLVSPSHLQASCERWTFWTQLGAGQYPNYQQVIPQTAQTRLVIPTSAFQQAVKSIIPFAKQDSHKAILQVDPASINAVVLSAEATDLGSNACVIDVTACAGAKVTVAFNYKGLQEVLPAIDAKRIIVELNGAGRPGKITTDPSSGGTADFLYLLAPIAPPA